MHNMLCLFANLPDEALLAEVTLLAGRERQATAQLIASLAELDARRLYLGAGCSSLFTYCTRVLRLSEHAAYGRIEAARAARRFPRILELLADGALNLTTVCLLAPHLTPDNHDDLLGAAAHNSKREVECLVAALRPQPDVSSSIRKLPVMKRVETPRADVPAQHEEPAPPGPAVAAPSSEVTTRPPRPQPTVVAPLAPERYKVQFTVSRETYEKLRRLQDLLRHSIPSGDPAAIVDRALTLLLADVERRKLASTARPRNVGARPPESRHVPAAVRREVWARDGGQCAFEGTDGRCTERGFLEFHHVVPYAAGGQTVADNLELRCRAHNAYEAEQHLGPREPSLVRERAPVYFRPVLGPDRVEVRDRNYARSDSCLCKAARRRRVSIRTRCERLMQDGFKQALGLSADSADPRFESVAQNHHLVHLCDDLPLLSEGGSGTGNAFTVETLMRGAAPPVVFAAAISVMSGELRTNSK